MTKGGRTKIPAVNPESDEGPTYWCDDGREVGSAVIPGADRATASLARKAELDVIAHMLERHHGFDPGRARALVWGQPGVVESLLTRRGRPPKRHLIDAADVADEVLSRGQEVRWDVVHRMFIAFNELSETRPVEYGGKRSREPRDSENWQRAVRRIRNRLRAAAAAIARRMLALTK